MQYIEKQIKKGIKLHLIKTEKFKTNLIAVFLTLPMARKEVTKNALISAVLRRGCKNIPTSTQISQELEEMYGASFDNGIDKIGDNHVLKFYLESINDNYLPEKNGKMLEISIEKLLEIIFEPLIEDALKRFKRQCARNGVLQEVRKREHYEKPSVRRKKKSEAARKRKF